MPAARSGARERERLTAGRKTPVHAALREAARTFAETELEPGARARDRAEAFDRKLFERAGEMGFLGVTVPEEYGGSGLDASAACAIHEEMSAVDPAYTLSYLAHAMLFANNLARNGSHAQKLKYLPKACSGEFVCGMGMSEPHCGTDVLGMTTTAKRSGRGGWTLNGRKYWITNGTVDDAGTPGDAFLVYARTGGPKDVSLFLVDGARLTSVARIKDKLGMRCSPTAELVLDNVEVPADALVGGEHEAMICMMRNLEIERVTLGAMATGLAERSLRVMNQYASDRVAFGKPIREFGQVQKHLADSYSSWRAARTYLYDVARRMRLDEEGQRLDTDGVKLVCTAMGKAVADAAIQVLGGAGYVGDFPVERLWRDAKLLEIGGGTLESHQKNMTRDLKSTGRFM